MHIAIIAWLKGQSVPPKGYGGIERFTEILAIGLTSKMEHKVTVIAPPGSQVAGCDMIECTDMVEAANIIATLRPDVVHDNTCWDLASPVRQGLKVPSLSTTHVNHAIGWTKNVVYLSQSQRTEHGIQVERNLNFSPIVRVPFDPRFQGANYKPDSDYCLYLGVVAEWKGVEEAAKLAQQLGKRLVVAGPAAGAYADTVKAYPNVEMVGVVDGTRKLEWIRDAYCVMCLHNSYGNWKEPGCGVVGEANAFNVPVAALHNGCLSELVITGMNGWIAHTPEELLQIMYRLPTVNMSRAYAEEKWSLDKISSEYINLYNQIISGVTWG